MATVIIYEDRVHEILRLPSGLVRPYIEKKVTEVANLARVQVGVKSGELRASISHRMGPVGGEVSGKVKASDWKALMHHEGTKPHKIPAKTKVLTVPSGQTVLFRQHVNHPGTKPNRFLTDNLKKVI